MATLYVSAAAIVVVYLLHGISNSSSAQAQKHTVLLSPVSKFDKLDRRNHEEEEEEEETHHR